MGGSVDTHITSNRGQVTLNEAAERVTTVAVLSRQFPGARILISSGANAGHSKFVPLISEAALARNLVTNLGVEVSRIELEEHSRDTMQNSAKSACAVDSAGKSPSPIDNGYFQNRSTHSQFLLLPFCVFSRTLVSSI